MPDPQHPPSASQADLPVLTLASISNSAPTTSRRRFQTKHYDKPRLPVHVLQAHAFGPSSPSDSGSESVKVQENQTSTSSMTISTSTLTPLSTFSTDLPSMPSSMNLSSASSVSHAGTASSSSDSPSLRAPGPSSFRTSPLQLLPYSVPHSVTPLPLAEVAHFGYLGACEDVWGPPASGSSPSSRKRRRPKKRDKGTEQSLQHS